MIQTRITRKFRNGMLEYLKEHLFEEENRRFRRIIDELIKTNIEVSVINDKTDINAVAGFFYRGRAYTYSDKTNPWVTKLALHESLIDKFEYILQDIRKSKRTAKIVIRTISRALSTASSLADFKKLTPDSFHPVISKVIDGDYEGDAVTLTAENIGKFQKDNEEGIAKLRECLMKKILFG